MTSKQVGAAQMKWQYETMTEKLKRLSQWHEWFAWYPVFHQGQVIWLEKIRRRAIVFNRPYVSPVVHWEDDF